MRIERRIGPVEVRASGRILAGTVMPYGQVSPSHRERFEPGAFALDGRTRWLDIEHDREKVIAWTGGGGLELRDSRQALEMRAELPAIPAADRALREVKAGIRRGLSVEFRALKTRQESGVRVIERADLVGVGMVRTASYPASRVEVRGLSGRTLESEIPEAVPLSCECSGGQCRYAEFPDGVAEEMLDEAFADGSTVVAGFGSYRAPLGSVERGTVRRVAGLRVALDLADDDNGRAVLAAQEAAGVIVRPYLDAERSQGERQAGPDGDGVLVYKRAIMRGLIVSVTDASRGWPDPEVTATPDFERSARRQPVARRRAWL